MKDLNIEETASSPEIVTDYENKEVSLKGKSYPENPFKFYEPLIDYLNDYKNTEKNLTLSIHLIYYNSSTTKVLYDILDMLDESNLQTNIKWMYNESNELALEHGEDYIEDYPKINIELIKI